jgi:hypothetical protein
MTGSSHTNAEPNRSRRPAWYEALRTVLAVLVLVTVADLSLRLWTPFELYDDWEHQQIAWKQGKFRDFVARRPVDVLLVGSSVIMDLDAKRVGQRARAAVFNGGIGGANPTAMAAIVEHLYLPMAKPKLLVYALSARDLRDTDEDPYDQPPFYSHRMRAIRAKTWQERLEVAVERFSYLFRVRRPLRDFVQRGELPAGVEITTDDYGSRRHKPSNLLASLKGREEFPADYPYRSRYRDYRIDRRRGHARQLRALIKRCRSLGIKVVVMNVPLSPAAMSLFDRRDADYRFYLKTLHAIAARAGVELYDAHSELQLGNADFGDADHLGRRGATKTEKYLAAIVAQHLARKRH